MLIRTLSIVTTLTCLTLGANAQAKLVVNPEQLTAGEKAEIAYSDPDRAGKKITIEIDNGSVLDPRSDSVDILLDEEGQGSGTWDVPDSEDWMGANFTGPAGPTISRVIQPPPDDTPPGSTSEHAPSAHAVDHRA